MTYPASQVWGDFETVRDIAEGTWEAREETGRLPSSVTKLRTSLFGAARYMRMTDFDEHIAGIPGGEAAWIEMMREHVEAIGRAAESGAPMHLKLARATAEAAARLADIDVARESDLAHAIGQALSVMVGEPAAHEHRFAQLPLGPAMTRLARSTSSSATQPLRSWPPRSSCQITTRCRTHCGTS